MTRAITIGLGIGLVVCAAGCTGDRATATEPMPAETHSAPEAHSTGVPNPLEETTRLVGVEAPSTDAVRYQPVPLNEIAADGTCGARSQCGADEANCGGLCSDIVIDPHNCGLCGINCSQDTVCVTGRCVPPTADFPGFPHHGGLQRTRCEPGSADCGGGCIDLRTDSNNCGCCGRECRAGMRCQNGSCR